MWVPDVNHLKCRALRAVCVVAGIVLAAESWFVFAQQEDAESLLETRTASGLHFKLPKDWPLERKNGVLAPVPVEEYLARKMTAFETRIQVLEQQLSSMEMRLRVYEQQRTPVQRGLRSGVDEP